MTAASEPTIRSRLLSFGFDKPTIPWSSFGEHLEFLADVGHTPNFAWFVGHNAMRLAAGVSGSSPTAGAAELDGGLRRTRRCSPGRSGCRPASSSTRVGRRRPTSSVRLNAVAGEYGGILHEPHPQPRLAPSWRRSTSSSRIARAGSEKAEISHLNVRHNTNAPERGWERAVETMAASREDGARRARRHDAVPRRARADGRDPAAVGGRGRAGGGGREAARPGPTRAAPPASATATGASSTRASGSASSSRRRPDHPDLGGLSFRQISERLGKDPWDCYFDILADGRTRLRVDPHGRDALHRRAPGGDDRAPALLPRGGHVHGFATRGRSAS